MGFGIQGFNHLFMDLTAAAGAKPEGEEAAGHITHSHMVLLLPYGARVSGSADASVVKPLLHVRLRLKICVVVMV